jgi:large subunit ribosomal protein L28
MSRECYFSGKRTVSGRMYTRRGLAKSKGGVGRKITGNNLRTFKPNVQKVRALIDGKIVRVKVSAKLIRRGFVTKPLKRTWKPDAAAKPATGKPAAEKAAS